MMKERILSVAAVLFTTLLTLPQLSKAQETEKKQPCAGPEASQFDFWVGRWDLTWGEDGKGTNTIKKIMDGCVIQENFDGTPSIALKGMSLSVYDPNSGLWRQTWVDNSGGYLDFTGGMVDDTMVLSRKATGNGVNFLQKMVFYNITENEFDWDWMRSDDDGANWKSLWQIHYKRKK